MKNNIFLFSHQDDEIAVFKTIKNIVYKKENIYIFFLTNGNNSNFKNINLINRRKKESEKVLFKLGVNMENIFFLGEILDTNSYKLLYNLDLTYKKLSNFVNKLDGEIKIFTHAWEGGNIDHDSNFILALKLMRNHSKIKSGFQFPFYNSYKMPFNLYRVFYPIRSNGLATKQKISFYEKIKFINYLFYYVSQFKVWVGLYPFIIFKIIFNKYNYLQEIQKKFILHRPHDNSLWYEKKKFIKYKKISLIFKSFLE